MSFVEQSSIHDVVSAPARPPVGQAAEDVSPGGRGGFPAESTRFPSVIHYHVLTSAALVDTIIPLVESTLSPLAELRVQNNATLFRRPAEWVYLESF